MADEMFSVVVMSKTRPSQIQMNFTDREAALNAFSDVQELTEREVLEDGFGTQVVLDPADIGNIFMQDLAKILKFQAAVAVMQAHARRGGLLVPANSIPQ